ncbi:hypothetical protein BH23BAC4_BH23BAC4_11750 [soil metagenome]
MPNPATVSGSHQKKITIAKLGEEPSDRAYWQSCSPQERIQALEELRDKYMRTQSGARPGFQRVCRITKLA